MLDRIRARYEDFRYNWEKNGLDGAIRSSARFVKNNRTLFGDPTYQSDRIDNDERWGMISAEIDPSATNVLDIGCNRGEMTRRAANKGLFSIGIDRTATVLNAARRRTDSPHCHFIRQELELQHVKQLPQFDVVFLLVVYYHWTAEFGEAKAGEMLKEVADRADQLFVETPNDPSYIECERIDTTNEPLTEIRSHLEEVVSDRTVSFVGETPYKGNERTDIIFEIS